MDELVFTEKHWRFNSTRTLWFGHSRGVYLRLDLTGVRARDILCVPCGCCMAVFMRLKGTDYENVGACFVLGYMDNEAGGRASCGAKGVRPESRDTLRSITVSLFEIIYMGNTDQYRNI